MNVCKVKELSIKISLKNFLKKIFLIFISLIFFSCSNKIITSNANKTYYPLYKPVSSIYDPVNDIDKIEIDNIELLFKYADFNFLSEKFSFVIEEKKIYKNKTIIHCIPFYTLQKNIDSDSESKAASEDYVYLTGLTPFYISIKNKNDHNIYIDLEKNAALVDENGRQYNPYNYSDLEKNNFIYTFRKKKKMGIIKSFMTPIFDYTGLSVLSEAIASTPVSKLSLFNVSVDDVTKTMSRVKKIYDYSYKYPVNENLFFKSKNIFPNAVENGFIVFPILPNNVKNLRFIINNIYTDFKIDGSPAKTATISVDIKKER